MEKGQVRSIGVFFFVFISFVLVGESSSMYFFQIGLHDISRSLAWKRDKAGMATHHGFFHWFFGLQQKLGEGQHISSPFLTVYSTYISGIRCLARGNTHQHATSYATYHFWTRNQKDPLISCANLINMFSRTETRSRIYPAFPSKDLPISIDLIESMTSTSTNPSIRQPIAIHQSLSNLPWDVFLWPTSILPWHFFLHESSLMIHSSKNVSIVCFL